MWTMPKRNHRPRYASPNGFRFKGKAPIRIQLGLTVRYVAALIDREDMDIPEYDGNLYKRCAIGNETRTAIALSLGISEIGLGVLLNAIENEILLKAFHLRYVTANGPVKPTKPTNTNDYDVDARLNNQLVDDDLRYGDTDDE